MSVLSYNLKGRLAGAIKHWFGKSAQTGVDQAAQQKTPTQTGKSDNSSNYGLSQSTAATHAQVSNYALTLPLQTILPQLSPELQERVVAEGQNVSISIPMQTILPQLAHGSVKISFGELRALAPGVFTSASDRDHVLVQLPLSEILPRINPVFLRRRQNQKRLEVPNDIVGPFADYGKGVFISAPEPSTQTKRHPVSTTTGLHPHAIAQPSTVQKQVPQLKQSQQPQPEQKQAETRQPTLTPTPQTPPKKPTMIQRTIAQNISEQKAPKPNIVQPSLPPTTQSDEVKVRQQAEPVTNATTSKEEVLLVPLAQLCEGWPELVKQEIAISNLSRAFVALPTRFVEAGLKQARISCTWKQLRGWVRPPMPKDSVSMCDDISLELPLRIVAPLFLARTPRNRPQKKIQYDTEIPDVFYTPATAPRPDTSVLEKRVQSTLQQGPIANEFCSVETQHTETPTETDYYIWHDEKETPLQPEQVFKKGTKTPGTDFLRRFAPPNEIVARAVALEGVAGALIALPDGLLVAADVPPEFNPDTLAAFLPQMFARVSQCTKELRMGPLNNLNFTVGNVPWRIFKIGAIFFAAFGRAGVPLPTAQLAALAAELDRKPRQPEQ